MSVCRGKITHIYIYIRTYVYTIYINMNIYRVFSSLNTAFWGSRYTMVRFKKCNSIKSQYTLPSALHDTVSASTSALTTLFPPKNTPRKPLDVWLKLDKIGSNWVSKARVYTSHLEVSDAFSAKKILPSWELTYPYISRWRWFSCPNGLDMDSP